MASQIFFELDPPRVLNQNLLSSEMLANRLDTFYDRVDKVRHLVDGILITDSVLGSPRLPSIYTAIKLRERMEDDFRVICSLRVSDHGPEAIYRLVGDAYSARVESVLLVKGDPPRLGSPVKGAMPTAALAYLRMLGFRRELIKLYLAVPAPATEFDLDRKLMVEPDGLVTQLAGGLDPILSIRDRVKDRVEVLLASLLVPSKKNMESAEALGLKLDEDYASNFTSIVKRLLDEGVGVIIVSPRSFSEGLSMLKSLKNS